MTDRACSLAAHLAAALALAIGTAPARAVPLPPPRPMLLAASGVPLPPRRPEEDGPPLPPPATQASAPPLRPAPPAPLEPDPACPGLFAGGTAVATALPAITDPRGCGIAAPVRLEAVVLRDGRRVALVPPATMRCDLAAALADWLRDDVAPASRDRGDLVAVEDGTGYGCRSRNHLPGERLSEHARGNAVDIVGLRFTGAEVGLADPAARPFWAALKPSACRRFATVLGPGADAFHASDLHLDLEHRRSGLHLCQWDMT